MFNWNDEKASRRMRRYLLYLRRTLVLLGFAIILAALIIAPIRIVEAVRASGDDESSWIAGIFGGNREQKKDKDTTKTTRPTTLPEEEEPEAPTDPVYIQLGGSVESEYAALYDMTEGRWIAAKNGDIRANPASITKVMTLLVAVENIENLDAEYTMSYLVTDYVARDASVTGFASGDKMTLRDLLYGCILPSGADAAVALAQYVVGDQADSVAEAEALFATMMNDRAAELGATNTHFVNASGLHDAQHKTTAMDMALILAAAMKNETCRQVLMAERYSSPATQSLPPQRLAGGEWRSTLFTSWLGADRYGILAGKTGYTDQALHTMATYTLGADGHEYVFVSMSVNGIDKAVADARYAFQTYCQ